MTPLKAIFAEIDARLAEVAGDEGSYERMPSGDPDCFPALATFDDGEEPSEHEVGTTRLDMSITVQGFVSGYGGAATHDAMIDLHAASVKALCGDVGGNLGNLVESIEIIGRRRVQIAELAKHTRLGFEQDFQIFFSTRRGDPSQAA